MGGRRRTRSGGSRLLRTRRIEAQDGGSLGSTPCPLWRVLHLSSPECPSVSAVRERARRGTITTGTQRRGEGNDAVPGGEERSTRLVVSLVAESRVLREEAVVSSESLPREALRTTTPSRLHVPGQAPQRRRIAERVRERVDAPRPGRARPSARRGWRHCRRTSRRPRAVAAPRSPLGS